MAKAARLVPSFLALLLVPSTIAAQTSQPLHVLTWNVSVGAGTVAHAQAQMQWVARLTPTPQVVVLQEAYSELINVYQSQLNAATGLAWNHVFKRHCQTVSGGVCTQEHGGSGNGEGVLLLTSLPMLNSEGRHFLFGDPYFAGRGAVRAKVAFGGGEAQVYGIHLGPNAAASRQNSVNALRSWMSEPALLLSPRFAGGDFNAGPTEAEIANTTSGMAHAYVDAWAAVHGPAGGETFPAGVPDRRIDYWFSDRNGRATPAAATVLTGPISDHRAVSVTYNIQSVSTPYTGTAVPIPGVIQAEHFDNGGQGIAYHDDTPGNLGGAIRTAEAVDIENASEGGYNVGWIALGEWLNYTINVPSTGAYHFTARVSSQGAGGTFHLAIDGQPVSGPIRMPDTGGWQIWQTVSAAPMNLTAGVHILRVIADAVGPSGAVGNWNFFQFTAGAPQTSTPYTGAPIVVPAVIQAEHFDLGGEGVAYHDDSPGNLGGSMRASEAVDIGTTADGGGGHYVGWFSAAEWLAYSIDVPVAGTYEILARMAHPGTGGTFHLEVGGVNVTGPMQAPNTGNWQAWQTVSRTGVTLAAGVQQLRLVADTAGSTTALGNLNWIEIRASGETILFEDVFQMASLDTTRWNPTVISGSQDSTVPVTQSGGQLTIGPLYQNTGGLHFNGITSANRLNLNNASVRVRRVGHPNTSTAATMSFTLPLDSSNHYRIFLESNLIRFEKKLAGVKTTISQVAFDPAAHAFWRIRHAAGDTIVFETAPGHAGSPGAWTAHVSVPRELNLSLVYVELKAGTWQAENAPGSAVFDDVRAARP